METAPPQEPASRLRGIAAVGMAVGVYFGIETAAGAWLHRWWSLEDDAAGLLRKLAVTASCGNLAAVAAIVLLVMWLRRGGEWRRTLRRWFGGGWMPRLSLGVALTLPIPLVWWLFHGMEGFRTPPPDFLLYVGICYPIGAPAEEILFRGFLFGVLWHEARLQPWAALVLSSILFALYHPMVRDQGLAVGIAAPLLHGVFGAVMCWTFWRTGESLWWPIGFHLAHNAWFALMDPRLSPEKEGTGVVPVLAKGAALALCLGVVQAMGERRKEAGTAGGPVQAAPGMGRERESGLP